MEHHHGHARTSGPAWQRMAREIHAGFTEFAGVPAAIIAGFLVLAVVTYALDHAEVGWLGPPRGIMQRYVFADARSTADLLGTIAAGLITVTSITFSLLLLAVQQSAASLTSQVIDQYLRRGLNQVLFGYFVGLALYALVILSTVTAPYNPVYGATVALVLMVVALAALPLLLYTTLHQMRPAVIVEAIHDHTLIARERQLELLHRTRRVTGAPGDPTRWVRAVENGFVLRVDLNALAAAIQRARGRVEVVLQQSIGAYVVFQQPIAEVRAERPEDLAALEQAVLAAIHLGRQRDLDADPTFGIEQLETIAWTCISTSKQNLSPGLLSVYALRDLLARWSTDEARPSAEALPVVYADDVLAKLMSTLESLAVVSTESMQHQIFTEVLLTFVTLFDHLPPALQERAEDLICRVLAGLGDHVPTANLHDALTAFAATLSAAGRLAGAAAVRAADRELGEAAGKLNSRSTRVPTGG